MRRLTGLVIALGFSLTAARVPAQQVPAARPAPVTVEIFDVGQGDAILIRSPEGKAALVDAGPSHHVVSLLHQRGVTTLDLVVISHHHADHYGGMDTVIRTFRPRVFLASSSGHTTPHYLKLLQLVRDQGLQAIVPTQAPRKIELGSVVLTVFPQPPEDLVEENNNSVGLRLQYGAFAVLLAGDAEGAERRWWEQHVPTLCADCTVLKLAHHGSRNGTDAPWLELVRPKLAVASLGRDNEFGHPHTKTLALLARMHIPLLRTDEVGSIVIQSDGTRWQVVKHPVATRGPPTAAHEVTGPNAKRREGAEPQGQRINLNTATAAELESLPGVGITLAQRIIAGRPYRSVDDLLRVEGFGPKRLAEIRPLVTAD